MLFGEGILIDSLFYLHKTLTKSEKSDKMYEVKLYAFFVIAKFLTKNFDKMVVEILSHTVNLKQNLLMGGTFDEIYVQNQTRICQIPL